MMLKHKVSQSLRMLLVVLAVGMMISVSGCSLWKRPKPKEVAGPQVTPPSTPEAPASVEAQHPAIGSTEEFPESAGVKNVYFDYDKATIRKDQLASLDADLKFFKDHADVKIMIEGHCDERGTVEYNFALGQRRAAAVQDYLLKNGIAADRLATVSKGEENPVDPGHNEAAWAKNRRAHFLRMY